MLYRAVFTVCTIGQATFMAVVTTALFGPRRNALEAAALGGAMVGMRVLAMYCSSRNTPLSNHEYFLTSVELTQREREIANLVLKGVASRAMGAEPGISENTVNSHVRNLEGKFGVTNRRQLLQLYGMARK